VKKLMQEVSWNKSGTELADDYTFFLIPRKWVGGCGMNSFGLER